MGLRGANTVCRLCCVSEVDLRTPVWVKVGKGGNDSSHLQQPGLAVQVRGVCGTHEAEKWG